jgi:ferredoxin
MPWVFRGLRNGVVTTRWPKRRDEYFDGFAAAVGVADCGSAVPDAVVEAAEACPTDAIAVDPRPRLDRGRCILCGRCVNLAPDWFAWERGCGTAELTRSALVVGDVEETDEALAQLRASLARRVRRLRRSVHLRHVDTGSNGSDEWGNPGVNQPGLRRAPAGHLFHRQPPSRRHPAGHRDRRFRDGRAVAPHARRDAGTYSGDRRGHRRHQRGNPGRRIHRRHRGFRTRSRRRVGAPASPFSVLHGILLALGRVSSRRSGSAR